MFAPYVILWGKITTVNASCVSEGKRGLHAASDEDCAGQDCSLTLFVGFTGSDRNGIALQTGSQINRLNQYSVSSLYNSVVSQVWHCMSPRCVQGHAPCMRLQTPGGCGFFYTTTDGKHKCLAM